MSAVVISDPMATSPTPEPPAAGKIMIQSEAELVKCECCGLTEECTPEYIVKIRDRYNGTWICGLCGEAVKDEIMRSPQRLLSTEEALNLHMIFCRQFKSSSAPPVDPTVQMISAMRMILRRSLDSPRGLRSTPSSPTRRGGQIRGSVPVLTRSGSCFPALSG